MLTTQFSRKVILSQTMCLNFTTQFSCKIGLSQTKYLQQNFQTKPFGHKPRVYNTLFMQSLFITNHVFTTKCSCKSREYSNGLSSVLINCYHRNMSFIRYKLFGGLEYLPNYSQCNMYMYGIYRCLPNDYRASF